eukprot:5951522-Amphidinium_carterae.1
MPAFIFPALQLVSKIGCGYESMCQRTKNQLLRSAIDAFSKEHRLLVRIGRAAWCFCCTQNSATLPGSPLTVKLLTAVARDGCRGYPFKRSLGHPTCAIGWVIYHKFHNIGSARTQPRSIIS